MGKLKKGHHKRHANVSDQVRTSKAKKLQKLNPFEIKVNKQKHVVLGKKIAKHDHGLPGVSRSKGIKKRQETLLVQYKTKAKENKLVDRRIGENDVTLSVEEKMLERFAKENKKYHEKASLFQLNDEDEIELTHRGQSLREIEKFDRPIGDDDSDEGDLTGDMVADGHFGGGILTKKSKESAEKTWKERMEEMIAKSKQAKHEQQAEKDELTILTEELDTQWKELSGVVATARLKAKEVSQSQPSLPEPADAFDIAVRQLRYESRGTPTDRTKTEEELAKAEKEKLELLEKERVKRMTKYSHDQKRHQSADDLDDGFEYDLDEEQGYEVKYKDGQLVIPLVKSTEAAQAESYKIEGLLSESESDDDDEEQESDLVSDDDTDNDSYGDLDSDEKEHVASDPENTESKIHLMTETRVKTDAQAPTKERDSNALPFTFEVPDSYSALVELLDTYSVEEQHTVLVRMRKCNHPSLAEGNKEKLTVLFGYLMEYFGDVCLYSPVPFGLLDHLTSHLKDLSKVAPLPTAQHAKRIILERHKMFSAYCQRKGGQGVWPFLDVLMYFKLFGILYSTSDYRHEVITPAMLFATQIYGSCPIVNHRDVVTGLFLSTVMYEFVCKSKALFPEVINFLCAVLQAGLPNPLCIKASSAATQCKPRLLCTQSSKDVLRLLVLSPFNLNQVVTRGVGNSLYGTDEFCLTALWTACRLLKLFIQLYKDLPSAEALFWRAVECITDLPLDSYPTQLQNMIIEIQEMTTALRNKKLDFVCRERKKPKLLRLYEPSIEESFDGRKKRSGDAKVIETQKLKHKYKKEMKGALREIRRDRSFLSNQKIQEQIQRDAERTKKTNQILADLQGQQHDINMFNKTKKPKHK